MFQLNFYLVSCPKHTLRPLLDPNSHTSHTHMGTHTHTHKLASTRIHKDTDTRKHTTVHNHDSLLVTHGTLPYQMFLQPASCSAAAISPHLRDNVSCCI